MTHTSPGLNFIAAKKNNTNGDMASTAAANATGRSAVVARCTVEAITINSMELSIKRMNVQ